MDNIYYDMEEMDLNEQIRKTAELSRKTNEALEKLGLLKIFSEKEEILFDRDIKKFGTGSGHIIMPQKYIGYKASVLVHKKKEEVTNKRGDK